jgi:hypothetical protein
VIFPEKWKHDELCEAFAKTPVVVHSIGLCSHIHRPEKAPGIERCMNHSMIIEKFNGTVGFQDSPIDLAAKIGKRTTKMSRRNGKRISIDNPCGYVMRNNQGRFWNCLTYDQIIEEWKTVDEFAKYVVSLL